MKTIFLTVSLAFILSFYGFSQNLNDSCIQSLQVCSGITYTYPLNINTATENGPNYGCLFSQPNPAWFFLKVASAGDFIFNIVSPTGNDVDFVCWGPFTSPTSPCLADLTANCTQCPNNTQDSLFYPSGNIVDCSYDPAATETMHIRNAQPNEIYIILITNYSNQQGTVYFHQSNYGQPNAGVAECNDAASISGQVYIDLNSNQIFDSNDVPVPYAMIESPKCGSFYFMTDNGGYYNGYVCFTPDTVKPHIPIVYPYLQSIHPNYYEVNNDLTNADFAVELQPNVCDVAVYMAQQTWVSMWGNSLFGLSWLNLGTTNQYVNLSLTLDTNFDFISASVPPTNIIGNTLYWDSLYTPLFANYQITLELAVNDTTLTNITPFSFVANASIPCNDADTTNNVYILNGDINTSFDPNFKEVNPEGQISIADAASEKDFVYTIHFQNTGTAPAHNITVVDTLSNWLNIPTFTFIGSSHTCTYSISEHSTFTFSFNNINLPDSATDEAGSHGYIMFKIKCLPALANGGNVYNKAYIYFDSNPAVVTNEVLTYVRNNTFIKPTPKPIESNLMVSPNPVSDKFTIKATSYFNKIEIYDINSKLVHNEEFTTFINEKNINKIQLSKGSYLIKAYGKNGKVLQSKFIVQ